MSNEPRNGENKLENALGGAGKPVLESGDRDLDTELRPRDWEQELENVIGGAAEAVFDSTDKEIEAELRSWGEDPDAVAEEVRTVLLDAVDRYERQDRECQVRVRKRASSRPFGRRLPS
ncbi:MAG: hypothetical protein V3T72_16695 [Thermoanaerobaculia bacterium]